MAFPHALLQLRQFHEAEEVLEMSVKTMLVHVDDSAGAKSRVDVAVRLANDVGARLIGAYLVPNAEITPSVAAMIPKDVLARRLGETARAQEAGEALFKRAAEQAGLDAEWRAPAGDAIDAAIAHGRYCDLLVLGQPDADDAFAGFQNDLLTAALLGLGRQILVVPYIGSAGGVGKRILVATDGGREAVRAIGDAWFLLERARDVKVLAGTAAGSDHPTFTQTSDRLAGWFRDHGVHPDIERYDAEAGDHGEWLLSRAADFAADLVVMGGYGHPRMREIVLGGMTRTILRTMTVPVLMSH
jgi:nucleotide-binding universal stress UspA family protein